MKTNVLTWILSGIVAVCALPLCGCGSSSPEFGSAPDEVIQLVGCIPDSTRSPQTFAAVFSSSAPPNDMQRRQFAQYVFVAKSASVSGDEATIRVEIRNPMTNDPIGQQEWTAVKEDGKWKLKTAPLPSGSQQSQQ